MNKFFTVYDETNDIKLTINRDRVSVLKEFGAIKGEDGNAAILIIEGGYKYGINDEGTLIQIKKELE